jgi:hypothetical protein
LLIAVEDQQNEGFERSGWPDSTTPDTFDCFRAFGELLTNHEGHSNIEGITEKPWTIWGKTGMKQSGLCR